MLEHFKKKGKASFLLGGQWGSEGKGAAAAFTAVHLAERREMFDVVTTNAGAQAGHTSTHEGKTKVVFHLPTVALYPPMDAHGIERVQPLTYLNAGSIIDPIGLLKELDENPGVACNFAIHPNAAVITEECREAEMRDDSAQTKIASTRKGVGEALSRKILRSGMVAKDHPVLSRWVRRVDLNDHMLRGDSVLVEVPQGHSLSIDGLFYPHTTSRNCTVAAAMSDAGIHPQFYHQSMMVIRTFPIRVGAITIDDGTGLDPNERIYSSGGHYPDQREITWDELGVKAEITTVTKRVRRVFTFSEIQVAEALAQTRPAVIYITFMDYLPNRELARTVVDRVRKLCAKNGSMSIRHDGPEILTQWGPTTEDVIRAEDLWA